MTIDSAYAGTTMGFVQPLDPANYGLPQSYAPIQRGDMDQFEVWETVFAPRELMVRDERPDGIAAYSFCRVLP